MSVLIEYFEALERLKKGHPLRVTKDTRISNDAVALEAGRKKGSIKKSRAIFEKLIEAIEEAANEQALPSINELEKLNKVKVKAENYRTLYEDTLAREVMLIKRIYELERMLAESTQYKVIPVIPRRN